MILFTRSIEAIYVLSISALTSSYHFPMSSIIDFHTHIFSDEVKRDRNILLTKDETLALLYPSPDTKMASVNDLINTMNEDGISKSVVMGIGWTDLGLARESNDYIIESINRFPDRLIGFAGVNPAWGDGATSEIERCHSLGLRGVGELHPDSQGFDITDFATMAPMMDVVQELDLILTTHSSEPVGHTYRGKGTLWPNKLIKFIENFPGAKIVCAHWGGGLPFYALMPEVKKAMTNVYFDTAASPFLYEKEVFQIATNVLGENKILMGSDYGLIRPARLLRQINEASINERSKKAILGGTAERLLSL